MIRTKGRLRLCLALLTLNLVFIWGNSLLPGQISGALSDWLKNLLSAIFGSKPGASGGGGLLRKLAHFTEFACLGMCLSWLFRMVRGKTREHIGFPLLAGIATAAIDETIQCFVPLRGPSIKDVGIDTLGVVLGIVIITLTQCIKNKKQKIWRKPYNEKADRYAAGTGPGHGPGGLWQQHRHQQHHRRHRGYHRGH